MKYLGVVLLVMSVVAIAEDAYYCSDDQKGIEKNKAKKELLIKKFEMHLFEDGNLSIMLPGDYKYRIYSCSLPWKEMTHYKKKKSCVNDYHNGYMFNFNLDNGRYVLAKGFEYVLDEDSVSVGSCAKFE
ncbi:MAG TPA: hypothetical protein EYN95_05965 [Methylococcaceae bacterium]|jgi:uridine kinase|nr:hypothetical protein [Methylococcaceae bacterium]